MKVRNPQELAPYKAWKRDLLSGFLVFLIALPLCLAISMASGFPPFSGVLTAVVGGLVGTFLGSAPLSIKGPAVGLIVIVLAAVEELGGGDPMRGYSLALGVVVVTGVIQAILGVLKAGKLGDFFPSAAVHGMLASIGIMIAAKQAHVLLGVTPAARGPISALLEIPHSVLRGNPGIAVIGLLSLLILFGWPLFKNTPLRVIPSPVVVLLTAIPLGMYMDLEHGHMVHWGAMMFEVGPKFLIRVPEKLAEMIHFADFSAITTLMFWKHVLLFTVIGGLESLLSAKAIDTLDPWGRKTDLNKDLFAQGVSNAVSGLLGGLPMISEIVRSSANVNNGGRTRLANFFHGAFLLLFIALAPALVHRIPLAALAAMLVYTGARLASPKEFANAMEVGREQFAIFVTTVIVALLTDLLIGIAAGIALKLVFHLFRGVRPSQLFRTHADVILEGNTTIIRVRHAAVFTNYLSLQARIAEVPADRQLVLDFHDTVLVDHTVMHHLEREKLERARAGGMLILRGLEAHRTTSQHPLAARVRRSEQLPRVSHAD